MQNPFVKATAGAIDRHGSMISYTSVPNAVYDVNTSSVVNNPVTYSLKSYMKHIKANQFLYPNLIGREAGMFYILAFGLAFVPDTNDTITLGTKTFKVDSVQSHSAGGEIVLYRVVGVI